MPAHGDDAACTGAGVDVWMTVARGVAVLCTPWTADDLRNVARLG
jgi:hypothetical protein